MKREDLQELLDAHLEGSLSPAETATLRAGLGAHPDLEAEFLLWEDLAAIPEEAPRPSLSLKLAEALETVKREERSLLRQKNPSPLESLLLRFWPARPAYSFAMAVLALVVGMGGGWLASLGLRSEDPMLRELRAEVQDTRELVVLAMLQQESATDRLRGVSYSARLREPNPVVIGALTRTMRYDTSVDVRLASIEALAPFAGMAQVRQAFLETLLDPAANPLVQVELVLRLGRLDDPQVRQALEEMTANQDVDPAVRLAAAQQVQATL